jgi:hypothetical protein
MVWLPPMFTLYFVVKKEQIFFEICSEYDVLFVLFYYGMGNGNRHKSIQRLIANDIKQLSTWKQWKASNSVLLWKLL